MPWKRPISASRGSSSSSLLRKVQNSANPPQDVAGDAKGRTSISSNWTTKQAELDLAGGLYRDKCL